MTLQVYAENFRGFKRIDLQLEDVQFLVGDNSSGKSSILHLINYIVNSDLLETPTLESELHIDRYDFFSPYFKNAPVTIGFHYSDEETDIIRLVTLSQQPGLQPSVDRFTVASGEVAMTVKRDLSGTFAALASEGNFSSFNSTLKHHRLKSGFKKVNAHLYGENINTHIVADICANVYYKEDTDRPQSLVDAIFGDASAGARHIGPVRSHPEKFYNFDRKMSSGGAHFASMWEDLSRTKRRQFDGLMRRFGSSSGMFDDVIVKQLSAEILDSPLLVTVKRNGKEFLLSQVGVGVSQIVPVLVETIFGLAFRHAEILLIQQPELHLHPRAQAAFGDFLFDAASEGMAFVVETHSDYLIDRFRAHLRDSSEKMDASIIFCVAGEVGNHVTRIPIDSDGALVDPPKRYFEFFIEEIKRTIF